MLLGAGWVAYCFLPAPFTREVQKVEAVAAAAQTEFSDQAYATILDRYVNHDGLVDYQGLKHDRERLDSFVVTLGSLSPQVYDQWSKQRKIAFWINAYNALTLKAIVDHYPIRPSFFRSLVYPENSIRQIAGVWDQLRFRVMGEMLTLDEIEHQILRKRFYEPRIHAALVCAAMGCPPLRREAFIGEGLDDQLEEQSRRFLSSPGGLRIDRTANQVYISSIFQWYGRDFVKGYGGSANFEKFGEIEGAVLNFISRHLSSSDREFLIGGGYSVRHLDYDWSLNEQ